jgi:sirohydrochlorin ferrochelatase
MGASVVEVAHMEIAEPTIEQAIGESLKRGTGRCMGQWIPNIC